MRSIILMLAISTLAASAQAQFVARMEVKEPIPGICNDQEVYALFPVKGQEKAVCPVTKDELQARLNSDVQYLKDNPQYSDKGMMNVIINCKGDLVQSRMDNKTKVQELDHQIEAVFATLKTWTPAKLKRREVDSSQLFSFTIENGQLTLN